MRTGFAQINLMMAWLWILLGFLSGLVLGLFFRDEKWLGGYAGFKRRMYRLGHISFFGLGAVNLLFWLTVRDFALTGNLVPIASVAFGLGALAMPVCCVVLAHLPRAHFLFAVPVVSLILGGTLMLILVAGTFNSTGPAITTSMNDQPSTIHSP
jgi:hypothetical protein